MPADMLPNLVVIGAMKCATSALHEYLDAHPDVSMSRPKELNFFNGPAEPPQEDPETWWVTGQWHRGLGWYASQFDAAPVRGESSPAYTSPSFPEVPGRMAAVVPEARLLYLVRDPAERALSQYAHHVRDGTERRPADEAVLDPDSQYLARSRYFERVEPFLALFGRRQLHVVVQERLLVDRDAEIGRVYEHVGVDPGWRDGRLGHRVHVGPERPAVEPRVRAAIHDRVHDDVDRLRRLLDDDLSEWDIA